MTMQDRLRFRAWYKDYYIYDIQLVGADWSVSKQCNEDCFGDFFYNEYCVIEQCTGLKDKNGNLIFEGDICRITGKYWDCEDAEEKSVNEIDTVKSLEEFFGEAMVKGIYTALFCETLKVEVIGNIHENPELLEVGGK